MAHNERRIGTSPERVWDVLADGWLYPLWVVGATRMREIRRAVAGYFGQAPLTNLDTTRWKGWAA